MRVSGSGIHGQSPRGGVGSGTRGEAALQITRFCVQGFVFKTLICQCICYCFAWNGVLFLSYFCSGSYSGFTKRYEKAQSFPRFPPFPPPPSPLENSGLYILLGRD